MRYLVQIPDYPSIHIVTGLRHMRGESGAKLLVAEATWTVPGLADARPVRDTVTMMLLADIVAPLEGAVPNRPSNYGARRWNGPQTAARRIAGATVTTLVD